MATFFFDSNEEFPGFEHNIDFSDTAIVDAEGPEAPTDVWAAANANDLSALRQLLEEVRLDGVLILLEDRHVAQLVLLGGLELHAVPACKIFHHLVEEFFHENFLESANCDVKLVVVLVIAFGFNIDLAAVSFVELEVTCMLKIND